MEESFRLEVESLLGWKIQQAQDIHQPNQPRIRIRESLANDYNLNRFLEGHSSLLNFLFSALFLFSFFSYFIFLWTMFAQV